MLSSRGTTSLPSTKRRGRLPQSSRVRKKQKRLVAICDEPAASYLAHRETAESDAATLRRSSRIRRAPVLLDSSPVPSGRRKKHKDRDPRSSISGGNGRNMKRKGKEPAVNQGKVPSSAAASVGEDGDWRLRLRSRGGKGLHYSSSSFREPDITDEARELLRPVTGEEKIGFDSSFAGGSRRRKTMCVNEVSVAGDEVRNQENALELIGKEYTTGSFADRALEADQVGVISNTKLGPEETQLFEPSENKVECVEESECVIASLQDGGPCLTVVEEGVIPDRSQEMVHVAEDFGSDQSCKHIESHDTNSVERDALKDNITEDSLKGNVRRVIVKDGRNTNIQIKEARRCGLCGCGSDGKPPKKLVLESFESENEAYGGSSASEEPNYDVWDGFGDEPCWLGRLLGPIRDRFGIPRVWVHQLCAVWSPEVYFAGLGCLKNVRAALYRGRALKCSRCGRPGATIGCRVDRCPKTYHLPCGRAEGCIFDHRKFLIACNDHRRFFQPHGNKYSIRLKKMKARKLRLDLRKISNESRRKDLEAEEKWLENCGEDEEFLRREGRRLQRDIVRIAPTYIGGSSESEKMYHGWESVAGLEHVIQCMKEVVMLPLLYPDFFANLGLTPPRGVLLHGYPGTGKTHVVRALIGACSTSDKRIAYFARKGADCLGKYVGDAERQLRLLFQVAERSQPSIIFFDEIDGLAPRRSKQQDQTHSSVVSTLLSLLDGLKSRGSVIVIGATNRPDAVDPALRRPGRFDREIYFPLPSEKDRSAILSLHTRSWPKPLCGSLLSWIANQTVGYAGADLQALCTHAAMHALKRNCALQRLLSSSEKGTIQGILSTLPSFDVEERDWLAALSLAPPPCSRREAGIAANDIVASPLPIHLVPSLLLPLVHLLISLYNDERIWLSPLILKASKTLKNVIVSALELKCLHSAFWRAHLHNLFKNQLVVDKVKKCFAHYGLIVGHLGFDYPFILDDEDKEPLGSLDSVRMNPSAVYMHRLLLQRCPLQIGNSVGFRALICGAPRSGQKHLASCLLHGFMGNLEICKVSLATIAQEGRGDMLHGLTQILLKCLDIGRCVVYIPRIDLWAIEGSENSIANDSNATPKSSSSSLPEMLSVGRSTEIWNSFAEQLDSVPMATSLAILATCEVEKEGIPPGLRQFFLSDTCSHAESNPTEYRIPRFFVQLDGDFDFEQSINLAAAKLSHDIVQHYLKLMHERSHLKCLGDVYKDSHYTEINSEDCKRRFQHATGTLEGEDQNPLVGKTIPTTLNMEHIAAGDHVSRGNDNVLHGVNNKRLPQTRDWGVLSQRYGLQGSFLRAAKVVKGNLILAIATFGYQILRYPQFAELCWVTSKLKEGPCTDISGPWKGWPFNTCVLHAECSPNKAVSGANSGNSNDKENSGVVRGLIAVGLLAYRGFYASVVEVSAEVRNVLELLVGKIRAKISARADRQRYFRILSQAAYLDDMVNSWAYMLQSLQADNNIAEFVSKTSAEGRLQSDVTNIRDIKIAGNQSKAVLAEKNCNIVSPHRCFTINGECANIDKVLNDSDAEVQHSFGHTSFSAKDLAEVVERSGLEDSLPSKGPDSVDNIPVFAVTENVQYFGAGRCNQESMHLLANSSQTRTSGGCCNDLNSITPNHTGPTSNEQGDDNGFTLKGNCNLPKVSCLYLCCPDCVQMINILARNTLHNHVKSTGCCSMVDDVHDVIVSCSLNILSSFRKCCSSENSADFEGSFRTLRCQSQFEEEDDGGFKEFPCHCRESEKIQFLPIECVCHTRMEDDTMISNTCSDSILQSRSTYFFRDGVLVPVIPDKSVELHCNFEKVCLCPIVMMLLIAKQTKD